MLARRIGALVSALSLGVSIHGAAFAQIPALPAAAPEPPPPEPAPVAPPVAPTNAPLPPPPTAPVNAAGPAMATLPSIAPEPRPAPESVAVPPRYQLVRVAEAGRAELPYEDGEPIPAGYHLRQETRRGLVIAGAIVMGVPWTFSVTGASADDFEHKSGFLLLPGVGPWLMLLAGGGKDVNCDPRADFCSSDRSALRGVLVLDGVVQSAGATLLTLGLLYPRQRLVPNVAGLSIVPAQVGQQGYGLGAVGTF